MGCIGKMGFWTFAIIIKGTTTIPRTRTPRTLTLFTPLTPLALPPRITYIEFMSKQRSLSQTTNVCLPTSTTGRTHIPFPPRTRPDMHHASSACSGQSRQRRHRRSLSPPPYPLTFHHQDTFESRSIAHSIIVPISFCRCATRILDLKKSRGICSQ